MILERDLTGLKIVYGESASSGKELSDWNRR